MTKKILIIGPAHPLRGGGMTTFNHRLAKEWLDQGYSCSICSFKLQYPGFLFPGKSQFTDEPAPPGIPIRSLINSINPFNWIKLGRQLSKEKQDIVIIRYWLPFMGPCLGTIARLIRKNHHSRIICIADNVIPHEKRFGDKPFTKYFFKSCDGFVTMSDQVTKDLEKFVIHKPHVQLRHPLYDNFGEPVSEAEAKEKLGIDPSTRLLLFFGFIRSYKGLDLLLEALSTLPPDPSIKLLIAGEFYGEEDKYRDLIQTLELKERLILHTHFIPDHTVKYYFCAADLVVQPYRHATQSGVTPLAFNYECPTLVTNVGGLPALIESEQTGLIAEPEPYALATAIHRFYQLGKAHFIPHLRREKEKYSWSNFINRLLSLGEK